MILPNIIVFFATCRHYDFIDIGTGSNAFQPDTRIVQVTGTEPPIPFKTPTNAMWVTFHSDYSKTQSGFNLHVTVDDEIDGE